MQHVYKFINRIQDCKKKNLDIFATRGVRSLKYKTSSNLLITFRGALEDLVPCLLVAVQVYSPASSGLHLSKPREISPPGSCCFRIFKSSSETSAPSFVLLVFYNKNNIKILLIWRLDPNLIIDSCQNQKIYIFNDLQFV